jgi:hypothetical protein
MYKIYSKEKNASGYSWKLTTSIEADELQVKNNKLLLIKDNKVVLVSPARYTQIVKE